MALASSSSSSCCCCVVDPERVITELSRGREIADRLRLILRDDSVVFSAHTHTLVNQLLDTFTHSLTMLQIPSEDCKTPPPPPPPKDRRGCYKRKRNSETVIKESPNMGEDGHAWRKYGQKHILNAKHPRNYFRCTHKYEQGCQASKQVQKVQDNPPLYRSTYNGHHTCTSNTNTNTNTNTSLLYHNNLISSSSSTSPDAVIWSFNTTATTHHHLDLDSSSNTTTTTTTASMIKLEDIHKSPSPPRDNYYMPDVYSCSDDTSNYIDDDISIDEFFELGTPCLST